MKYFKLVLSSLLLSVITSYSSFADAGVKKLNLPLSAEEAINFKAIPPTPKLPKFIGDKQFYALFLFGKQGEHRVWAVLDKSSPDKPAHDVLYLDFNANGDLTEANERLQTEIFSSENDEGAPGMSQTLFFSSNNSMSLRIPGSQQPLKIDVYVSHNGEVAGETIPMFMMEKDYDYKPENALEYEAVSINGGISYMKPWGDSPEKATTFAPGIEFALTFETQFTDTLPVGEAGEVVRFAVEIGDKVGKDGFTCVSQDFLPKGEYLLMDLIYTDKQGRQKTESFELKERCCGTRYYGMISMPKDIKPGKAIARVKLQESSQFYGKTTDLEVNIVDKASLTQEQRDDYIKRYVWYLDSDEGKK